MVYIKFWRWLVLCTFTDKIICATANENQSAKDSRTPENDVKLIFDVTNHSEDIVANFCNSTTAAQSENQWRMSTPLYMRMSEKGKRIIEIDKLQNPDTERMLANLRGFQMYTHLFEDEANNTRDIALLTNIQLLCNHKNLSTLAEAVGPEHVSLRFTSLEYECQKICLPLPWIYSILKAENTSFGIDIDQSLFECLSHGCLGALLDAKFLVLNTELKNVTNTLSYGAFSRQMNFILQNEYEVWKRYNPAGLFYIRVSIIKTLPVERDKEDYVKAFVEQFATAWLQNKSNVSIIVETHKVATENRLKLRHADVAIPHINVNLDFNYENYSNDNYDYEWNDFPSSCELLKAIKIANPVFKTYLMEVPNWSSTQRLIQDFKTCKAANYLSNDTSIVVIASKNQTFSQEALLKMENLKTAPLLNVTKANFNNTLETHVNVFNTAACFRVEPTDSFDLCQLQNQTSIWLYRFKPNLSDVSPIKSNDSLDFRLSEVVLNSEYIKSRNYAGGLYNHTFWIDYRIMDSGVTLSNGDPSQLFRVNLYCSEDQQNDKEMQEAIINWAKIHDVMVTSFSLIDQTLSTGWWYKIVTELRINLTATNNFAVLVRRNVPSSLDSDFANSPYTYPCVSVSNGARDINAKNSSYVGISVNLNSLENFKGLNENDIRALIFIALSRFNTVHIKAKSSIAMKMIDALNINFKENLNQKIGDRSKKADLFLEYDTTDLSSLKHFHNIRFPLAGVHVSGCHSQAKCRTAKLLPVLLKMELKYGIGIVIEDCIDFINQGPNRIRNHPLFNVSSHIVCQNGSGDLISKYFDDDFIAQSVLQLGLDTTFYVQQYFSFHFNKTTYWKFRFEKLCTPTDSVLGYMRFMDVYGQYADGYRINYILGEAFLNCSWWHIDNYNDLLNASAYVERVTGERPEGTLIDYLVPISLPLSLVICLSVLSLLLFAGICGFYAYHRLKTKKLLSKQEVMAFVNGEEIEVNTELIGLEQVQIHTTRSLGFNKVFEIPKRNITLGRLIGSGNFGQVFEGTLNDGQKVAIKQPKPECSKEVFKTMLAETKVLSYLVEHENVVNFIGAYTKEIDVGIIYIVTGYCENGTLKDYLNQRRIKPYEPSVRVESLDCVDYITCPKIVACSNQNGEQESIVPELCRLAMEIASGMNYISERRVVHADLSARNVLMDGNGVCKIADFGLSRKLYESEIYKKEGKEELPWRWMAIESLKNMEFTTKSDVWSYAVTLWEIFSLGHTPYPGVIWDNKFITRLEGGLHMPKPEFASVEIYEKMLSCWYLASGERPTFLELFEFFRSLETISF